MTLCRQIPSTPALAATAIARFGNWRTIAGTLRTLRTSTSIAISTRGSGKLVVFDKSASRYATRDAHAYESHAERART